MIVRKVSGSPMGLASAGLPVLSSMLSVLDAQLRGDGLVRPANLGIFPPYDLSQVGEDVFVLELAVAGFRREDLSVVVEQRSLVVTGSRGTGVSDADVSTDPDGAGVTYLHRGLVSGSFRREFGLEEHLQVRSASLNDGVLRVELQRVVPEAARARVIDIS